MAAQQQTLTGDVPHDAGIWRRLVGGAGQIDHAAWMRACAEGSFVGTCRQCGDYLIPERPRDITDGRTDYEARCRNEHHAQGRGATRTVTGCGWTTTAPGGRIQRRSNLASARPKGA